MVCRVDSHRSPSWATFRARLAGTSTTSPSRLAK